MIDRLVHRLILCLSALAVALAATGSAAAMAPDRDALARASSAAMLGVPDDALCLTGGEEEHAEHRCPFCHLLPDPPPMRMAAWRALSRAPFGADPSRDLVRGPYRLAGTHAPRAPPAGA